MKCGRITILKFRWTPRTPPLQMSTNYTKNLYLWWRSWGHKFDVYRMIYFDFWNWFEIFDKKKCINWSTLLSMENQNNLIFPSSNIYIFIIYTMNATTCFSFNVNPCEYRSVFWCTLRLRTRYALIKGLKKSF